MAIKKGKAAKNQGVPSSRSKATGALDAAPAKERIFQSQRPPRSNVGWRITMVVEAHSPEMLGWAMTQAFDLGHAMFINVEVSHKDDPATRVKVRTTKLRKSKVQRNSASSGG